MDKVSADLTKHHAEVKELLDWASDNITDEDTWEICRADLAARFLDKVDDYGELNLELCCKQCKPADLLKRSLENYLAKQHADCWNLHFLAFYVAVHNA